MRLNPTSLWPQAAPFFDKLVFSKIKLRLGGRVKLIVTGGAPLARHVEDFLKVTMCCPVVQGYGLTETCGASFIAVPDSQVQRRSLPSAHLLWDACCTPSCTPLCKAMASQRRALPPSSPCPTPR